MDKKKSLYLTSGILGLTTAALLATNSNSAQAASKGTVSYSGGATTIWDSPNNNQKPQGYLQSGQTVTIQASRQVYNQTWYQLADNQWVSGQYITPESANTTVVPAKTNAVTTSSASSTAGSAIGSIQINYQGGATTVWAQPNFRQHTGRYLTYGTTATIVNQQTVNGALWYQLEDQGWVPAEYATVVNNGNSSAEAQSPIPVHHFVTSNKGVNAAAPHSVNTQMDQPTTVNTNNATSSIAQPIANADTNSEVVQNTANTNSSSAQAVVNAALSQVGTPYVWGGATPNQGLDCSGLVQYAYAQANVAMGHYTVAQEGVGQQISLNNLQPGDIIFWGNAGASYHDAIYIGNGQYVHAPQPGETVKVASISQYFMPSFAVRVF